MSRLLLVLAGQRERQRAHAYIDQAPVNSRLELKAPRRSLPQNDAMWAALTDIARTVPWHGIKLPAEDWKLIFLDALKRENRLVPNLENNGFVSLGRSSSDLTRDEMGDLLTLIHAWGAANGVEFSEPAKELESA